MLRARPTVYQGIRMRSRLEATVAANLDSLGVRWSYEPGAFAAAGMEQWLPDYRIGLGPLMTEQVIYIEVKGTLGGSEATGGRVGSRRALMTRMAVAWESEPAAVLVIAEDQWDVVESNPGYHSLWVGVRGRGWSLASFMSCRRCREVHLGPFEHSFRGLNDPHWFRPSWGERCCDSPDKRLVDLFARAGR